MTNAARHLQKILARTSRHGFVLMLDFDGTLSDIVRIPRRAACSRAAARALRAVARRAPIAIVSGRSLADIRRRIRIPKAAYAGCHGLEWALPGKSRHSALSARETRAFNEAKRAFRSVARAYPGVVSGGKGLGVTLNYRALKRGMIRSFRRDARKAARPYVNADTLRVLDSLYSFDISPKPSHTKGSAVLVFHKKLKRRPQAVPVYIGDSDTDEDAFRALTKGITIRVGKKRGSAAAYYFKTRRQVDAFLAELAAAFAPQAGGTIQKK